MPTQESDKAAITEFTTDAAGYVRVLDGTLSRKVLLADFLDVLGFDELVLAPDVFGITQGSPARAISSNGELGGWAFDPTTQEAIGTAVKFPKHWNSYSMHIWWYGNGTVRWQALQSETGDGGFPTQQGGGTHEAINVSNSGLLASGMSFDTIDAAIPIATPTTHRHRTVGVTRVAAHANDTSTSDAFLLSVILRRVT